MKRPQIVLVIGLQLTGVGSDKPQLPFLARGCYLLPAPNCSFPGSVAVLLLKAAWTLLALSTTTFYTAEHTQILPPSPWETKLIRTSARCQIKS